VVSCSDVRVEDARWPEYAEAARRVGVAAVAGVPMRLADQVVGAMNIYDAQPREWSEEDLAAASVLADVATSYLVNASKLHQQQQLNEQLTTALESRAVIEQAKGITAGDAGVSVQEAYHRIRRHARNHNTSLRAVAEAVVNLGLRV
jgi:GAF domain-containing protein